ncbi:LysR family transcriptional regulator [Streptomyces sp. NPDC088360]|uniref:LysR family transcriptional regulator n=1 Tax=Streptomyces sp. NPDC088360 TaxID=3154515 RepID=UPI00344BCD54
MDWTSSQLRSLVELTRRGTITAVAQALGYTPGGVSQQIAALEKAAGTPLLRRVGRRVELTDAGTTLARHAERILATEAEAVEELERGSGTVSGTLLVGLFATAAAEILPPALRQMNAAHPDLAVHSRDMDVDEVYDAVASGGVDLALGLDYPDVPIPRDAALRVARLYRERFALAVPTGWMQGRDRAALADTRGLAWILPSPGSYYGRAVRTACRRAGIEPDVRHEVTDTAATLALVEAGIGREYGDRADARPARLALRRGAAARTGRAARRRGLPRLRRTAPGGGGPGGGVADGGGAAPRHARVRVAEQRRGTDA